MKFNTLTPKEKIQKAKIKVGQEYPFFGHLVLHLEYVETDAVPTLAVDPKGNMYYNPDYVEEKSLEEMKAVVTHEIMHCGFNHFERTGSRDHKLSNYAQDLVINDILVSNGFQLPDDVLVPRNHSYTISGVTIENLHEKSYEQVYEELEKNIDPDDTGSQGGGNQGSSSDDPESDLQNQSQNQNISGSNDSNLPDRGDVHMNEMPGSSDNSKDGEKSGSVPDMDRNEEDKDFENIMNKAQQSAKQQGQVPAGMERVISDMREADVNWRTALQSYVTNKLPFDYTMERPNKKYRHMGLYLPDVKKESLEVVVAIDTSGSISEDELEGFLGEVVEMCEGFDNVEITVVQHDAQVTNVDTVSHSREVEDIELKGGGGTDHRPVYEWIEENKRDAQLLINFTDGYTHFPPKEEVLTNLDTIWVLDNYSKEDHYFDYGKIIRKVSEDEPQ